MKGGAPVSAVYALDVERSLTHDTRIKRNAPTKEQDKRTRASHPHRTFHLGLIVRDDLLVLLESRGGHRSSGSQGDTLQVGGSPSDLCRSMIRARSSDLFLFYSARTNAL